MQDPENRYHHSRPDADQHDKDLFIEEGSLEHIYVPLRALPIALSIGALGGILIVIISVATTLANASAFQTAARQGNNISLSTAQLIVGLTCVIYTVSLVVAFVAGYLVGKKAVRRLYGFYAGLLVGGIAYIGSILVAYIPNYPGRANTAAGTSPVAGGLLVLLITTVVWMVLGALISLWGAFTATRKHPYYLAKQAQEDAEELLVERIEE
jgi:uncharacterized membrane protein